MMAGESPRNVAMMLRVLAIDDLNSLIVDCGDGWENIATKPKNSKTSYRERNLPSMRLRSYYKT